MTRFRKGFTVTLIFTLLGVFLWMEVSSASDIFLYKLRVPADISSKRQQEAQKELLFKNLKDKLMSEARTLTGDEKVITFLEDKIKRFVLILKALDGEFDFSVKMFIGASEQIKSFGRVYIEELKRNKLTGKNFDFSKYSTYLEEDNDLKKAILYSALDLYIQDLILDYYSKKIPFVAQEKIIVPSPYFNLNSLYLIKKIVESGKIDVCVCIGTKGFSYGAIFDFLGIEVLNIEAHRDTGEYREIDDLSSINGKRVLVVEDDVKTGETLTKVLENISRHSPDAISLYLGNSEVMNSKALENIPDFFVDKYISKLEKDSDLDASDKLYALMKMFDNKQKESRKIENAGKRSLIKEKLPSKKIKEVITGGL